MITRTDAEKLIAYFNTIGSQPPAPVDVEHLARTVIALWDRVERLEEALLGAIGQLRAVASVSRESDAFANILLKRLKETTHD